MFYIHSRRRFYSKGVLSRTVAVLGVASSDRIGVGRTMRMKVLYAVPPNEDRYQIGPEWPYLRPVKKSPQRCHTSKIG